MIIIKTSFIYSTGSMDRGPRRYHRWVPRISGANTKSPAKATRPTIYRKRIRVVAEKTIIKKGYDEHSKKSDCQERDLFFKIRKIIPRNRGTVDGNETYP